MFLGLSAMQLNALSDLVIAYLFVEVNGERIGPAVLSYAQFLYQLPLGVFGIGLATAIFPSLSDRAARKDRAGVVEAFQQGIRLSLFIALPATVGLIFVAEPLVAALYQHGEFGPEDTRRVAATLICYSLGLAAYFAQHVVVRVYYAMGDTRTPARMALRNVILGIGLNLILVFPMQERGPALATSICAVLQVASLCGSLRGLLPEMWWRPVLWGVMRTAAASGLMTILLLAARFLQFWALPIDMGDVLTLVGLVLLGTAGYFSAAHCLRIEELRWILRRPVSSAGTGSDFGVQ
jgi:putative peptidoglycan lipid II flippase